jgi:transcriptional regulator with XRE-family HTH domain
MEVIMEDKFSNRLQKAMQIRNIKASELSEKANIPKSAISQYLSGLYEAKQKSIFKLANVLDVSEGWLMGYDVPMEKNFNTYKVDKLGNSVIPIPILRYSQSRIQLSSTRKLDWNY